MPREKTVQSGRSILLIDDNEEYLVSSARVVTREGHETLTASTGQAGLEILRSRNVDLVLVDYFMPTMTGEQFVSELRTFKPHVQVILQTGYASERPPREMLRRLDIQGYHDKNDGPEKLCLWIDVGLKAAFTVQLLMKSRQGLAYILGVTPDLHRIQALEDLLRGVLLQTVGLLGAVDSFVAVTVKPPTQDAFIGMVQAQGGLRVHAGTGRFEGLHRLDASLVPEGVWEAVSTSTGGRPVALAQASVVPLRYGDALLGAIYIDRPVTAADDAELLAVFANQAAVAIQNGTLYELAAIDQLTRVYTRKFLEHALLREVKHAYRHARNLSVLVVDIDEMKHINDAGGHLAGDRALERVGALLKRAVRTTDVVGRYGGDEFVIVLPDTDRPGAEIVCARILAACVGLSVEGPTERLPVHLTVGGAVISGVELQEQRPYQSQMYFEEAAKSAIAAADRGLYRGKRNGKSVSGGVELAPWPEASLPTLAADAERSDGSFGLPILDGG